MLEYTHDSYKVPITWRTRKSPVYRLLDNTQWIDNFFASGEIRLSCFNKFRNNPDEFQGDPREADALCYFRDGEGKTIGIKYESGLNSYVLSATETINDKIKKDFNAVGGIKILNTTYFALEIAKKLNFCLTGVEGKCIYANTRVFELKQSGRLLELSKDPSFANTREFREELRQATLEYELFVKTMKYEYQNEFRMIWYTPSENHDYVTVSCPEAIQYCERIDFDK